jgi:hypothetical protein
MGNSFVFDNVYINAFAGNVIWPTSSSKIYLVLGTVSPTTSNKQTWSTYNSIKWAASSPYEIAAVNGYALGGSAMNTTAPTLTTDTTGFGAGANTVFTTTGTISAAYAATQYAASSSTTTTNPLMSHHDLSGTQVATNGTLTLTWSGSGVWTITSSAAA